PAVDSPLVASTDFTQEIPNLRSTLSQIEQVTDVEALDAKIADLEQQATAQDLWDDVDNAQQVTSALSHAHSERRRITELTQRLEHDINNAQRATACLPHAQLERRRITELTQRIGELGVTVELAA